MKNNVPETSRPETLEKWKIFLQDDAKKHGGTASIVVRHQGELVRITACSRVIITQPISEFEFAIERAVMMQEILEEKAT